MEIIRKWWFWFGLSFLLYANTLNHGYTVDDLIVVTSNKMTQQGTSAIPDIFKHSYLYGYDGREDESYRPLTLASFAIEKSIFDAKSSTSHLIQVLLYALLIVVLFKFLLNLIGEERFRTVAIITLLFLLHPIHTEVVSNVKSRDELLSAFFLFSALLLFSKYVLHAGRLSLVFSLILFFAATLSKETAVLGVLLFPATYYYMKGGRLLTVLTHTFFYALPFLLYFGIRALVLTDVLIETPIDPVANSLALASTSSELFASNLSIFSKYIQLCFFPFQLSWDYSIASFSLSNFGSIQSIVGLIFLLIILASMFFGLIKRNLIGFGALLFASTFALTSNFFFLINCTLGERFLFMPVLGIIIMFVIFIEQIGGEKLKFLKPILLGLICVFFAARTFTRNMDWKDNLSIYEAGVRVCPNSVKTHFNLGTEYLEQGNRSAVQSEKMSWFRHSLKELKKAKKIYPAYVNTYENMGFVYAELGKIAERKELSIRFYKAGLEELTTAIDSLNLDKPSLFQNKFFILEQLITLSEDLSEKDNYRSDMVNTVNDMKNPNAEDLQRQVYYLRFLNRDDELILSAKKMVKLFPDKKEYLLELSKEFFSKKKYEESLSLMSVYVDLNPADLSSKSNMGMLLEILGRKKEALSVYQEILETDPNQQHTKELYEKLKRNK